MSEQTHHIRTVPVWKKRINEGGTEWESWGETSQTEGEEDGWGKLVRSWSGDSCNLSSRR